MGHEFNQTDRIEVPADPEQVWQAIATGPGIDSWFMGRNDVDEATATVRQSFGDFRPTYQISEWEPMRRLAYANEPGPDGRFVAYEFLIEGRDRSSTVLRMATSGFLPGDDWNDEFEAMRLGFEMFFSTLLQCLLHFPGRTALPLTVFGPSITDWPATWHALRDRLGLSEQVRAGDQLVLTGPTGPTETGEVYFVNEQTLGVRTPEAIYRFMQGFGGSIIACHSMFSADYTEHDRRAAEKVWHAWFDNLLSGKENSR